MAALLKSDKAFIEIHESYPKQTIRNHCIIATSAGELKLTVPVSKPNGNHTKTNEVLVDYTLNWQQTHWRSMITAYNKTPWFLYYRDAFQSFFKSRYTSLIELNNNALNIILKLLGTTIPHLEFTSEFTQEQSKTDFRNSFNQKLLTEKKLDILFHEYYQPFSHVNGFLADLSIVDLLFNAGPDSLAYLHELEMLPVHE
jgi:hypothetical protein